MAKQTLLDMVQTILTDMVAGQVNSIADTEEALAVAGIIKRTYFDILSDHNLPTRRNVIQLTALGDTAKPTTFRLPESSYSVDEILYDCRTDVSDTQIRYTPITYVPPDEFFDRGRQLNTTDSNVLVVTLSTGVKVPVRTDANPTCWTSFDNEYVMMDAYDATIESTLQQSKVAAFATSSASWVTEDEFVPDLPEHLFPLLLSVSENRAFEFLKQTMSVNVDKQERRARRNYDAKKNRVDNSIPRPNFGR